MENSRFILFFFGGGRGEILKKRALFVMPVAMACILVYQILVGGFSENRTFLPCPPLVARIF